MPFNLIIIIFVISCFAFIIVQCYEFIQNYNYIQNFNKKYSKYEFTASPSYNYVDKSYYDPNDVETDVKKKWVCKMEDNNWYGLSPSFGLILKNNDYASWQTELDCIDYIFSNFYLNYNNPCLISDKSNYCKIYTSLK